MHFHSRKSTVLSAVMLTMCAHLALAATEENPVARQPVAQAAADNLSVIVKLRKRWRRRSDGQAVERCRLAQRRSPSAPGSRCGLRREISESDAGRGMSSSSDASAAQVLEQLRADAAVEYVAIDQRRFPHATDPNDALFANQWYLKDTEVSAVNAIGAWDSRTSAPRAWSSRCSIPACSTTIRISGRADRGGKLLPGLRLRQPACT